MRRLWSHKWFSILMALGITAILMIAVTSLATIYIKEYKISRLSYDEVLSEWVVEWMFEYGMLKIRNHADGFADEVSSFSGDLDANMFKLSTPRSEGMNMKYTIEANSTTKEFTIGSGSFLTIPLFIGTDDRIESSKESFKPNIWEKIKITEWLQIEGLDDNIHWTISATDENGKNIWLQGKWNIDNSELWELQLTNYYCVYFINGTKREFNSSIPCLEGTDTDATSYQMATDKEELQYSYKIQDTVGNFFNMKKWNTSEFWKFVIGTNEKGKPTKTPIQKEKKETFQLENFYLILYNSNTSEKTITITSKTPFALPHFTIKATASKGDASQVFKFSEDKSRIFDALKYGYYDPTNLTTTR